MPPLRSIKVTLPYSGFVLAFEPKRTPKIVERLSIEGEAVEAFSAMDWKFEPRELALIVFDRNQMSIGAAVLMERMYGSGGTAKLKMRLTNPVIFSKPVGAESVHEILSLQRHVSTAENVQRITPDLWPKLITLLKTLRPDSATALNQLFAERDKERRLFGDGDRLLRLVEQRDCVGLTLEMAGLDRKTALRSLDVGVTDEARSILDLLDNESLHEQDAIRHDERVFEGLLNGQMRHGVFTDGKDRAVRIHVYDKKPLESVLGIDLLVFQEAYQSFLLLQYKMMKPSHEKNGKTWSYLVDSQLRKQMELMDRAQARIYEEELPEKVMWDWRLNGCPFYFKFCEATRSTARADGLVRGLTISLEHLTHFLSLDESRGEQGGRRVGYTNCPRYLNNTQFVELARDGWIGCDRSGYEFVKGILEAGEAGGRLAMFAVVEASRASNAIERGWRRR